MKDNKLFKQLKHTYPSLMDVTEFETCIIKLIHPLNNLYPYLQGNKKLTKDQEQEYNDLLKSYYEVMDAVIGLPVDKAMQEITNFSNTYLKVLTSLSCLVLNKRKENKEELNDLINSILSL